jgi:diguanylate cyclase (GGDEF)-like protein/PAS domain S-box-containing protein
MVKMLGYSRKELNGMYRLRYENLIYKADYAHVLETFQKVCESKLQDYHIEYRCVRKNGDIIWTACSGQRIEDIDGKPAYLCVVMDITKQQEIREQLKIREEEYRIAVQFSDAIIYRFDIRNKTLYMPEELAMKYHLPSHMKDVPYSTVKQGYIVPECIDTYISYFESIEKGSEGETAEIGRILYDGTVHWYKGDYQIVRDSENHPVSATIIFSDITEVRRKNLEIENLKQKQKMIEDLTGNPVKNLVKYDIADDRLEPLDNISRTFFSRVSWDRFSVRLFHSDILMQESKADIHRLFQDLKEGKAKGVFHCRVKNPCGLLLWYECTYSTSFNAYGKPDYAFVSFRDVTVAHEKEVAFLLYRDLEKKDYGEKTIKIQYNLSMDLFEYSAGRPELDDLLSQYRSYTGILPVAIEKYVFAGDRAEFLKFLSKDRLMSAFENGTNQSSIEFRLAASENKTGWVRASYQMIQDPYSSQIKILFFISDISEEKEETETMRKNAEIDMVSGIMNRQTFAGRMNEILQNADRGMVNALAVIDVDHFKQINDAIGHTTGDSILNHVAHIIQSVALQKDVYGRIGGDEFGIFMTGLPDREVLKDKIDILKNTISRAGSGSLELTVSIGLSLFPHDGASFDELYRKADRAMYQAKIMGGNQYAFYSDAMTDMAEMTTPKDFPERQNPQGKHVFIRTFGYFDVFVDGKAIPFQYAKTKELLALLTDRRGGFLTSDEAVSCLWEDEAANELTHARSRKVAMRLKKILNEYGVGDIIESKKNARRLVPEKVECDLFNYLSGDPKYKDLFMGSYMNNYTWGEMTLSDLLSNTRTDR